MPRYSRHDPRFKLVIIVFIAAISISGVLIYYLYSENESRAKTIVEQASTILGQIQKIAGLEADVENKSAQISNLNTEVKQFEIQVKDLGFQLGITQQSLEELRPKILDYYVVGVKTDGTGVVIPLEIKVVKGTGSVSANINKVELLSGVQDSIRAAVDVASRYAEVPILNKDITISFVNEGPSIVTVDGGSAGAAMTASLIAVFMDETVDTSVLMTGTINFDGAVGKISSAIEKAQAAKDFGAKTFLIPEENKGFSIAGLEIVTVTQIDEVVNRVVKAN